MTVGSPEPTARTAKGAGPGRDRGPSGTRKVTATSPSAPGNSTTVPGSTTAQADASPSIVTATSSTAGPVLTIDAVIIAVPPGTAAMAGSDSVSEAPTWPIVG